MVVEAKSCPLFIKLWYGIGRPQTLSDCNAYLSLLTTICFLKSTSFHQTRSLLVGALHLQPISRSHFKSNSTQCFISFYHSIPYKPPHKSINESNQMLGLEWATTASTLLFMFSASFTS